MKENLSQDIYNFDKEGHPLIKVLTRTYGEHKTLTEEAIYSFLQQDYPNKQLIILNTHNL
jgi:cellulose synthase/poly-beta-1,6-N-acetylglucosamine synthase-like glycosyltransferase